jgi:phosphoenolpyruvate synthase/pyruvate phosphate dikinase
MLGDAPIDAVSKMQRMVMAEDEAGRRAALDELLPLKQADFEGLFEAMTRLPVAIRLLDPPLHEFLPDRDELVERIAEARLRGTPELGGLEHELERVRSLEEGNPMLGTRGVRLGLFHPEIYEMQVRAISRATGVLPERTCRAPPFEIMSPTRTTLRGNPVGGGVVGADVRAFLVAQSGGCSRGPEAGYARQGWHLAVPAALPSAPRMSAAPPSSGPASTT